MNDRSASGRKDWFCVALDSIPAAVIPSPPRPKGGGAGTFKAADTAVNGTAHHSSAGESADTAARAPGGSAKESTNTQANSAAKSATGSASGKDSGASANGKSGPASQPQNGAESNFLQALAQSQAAAANDASASATTPASAGAVDAKAKAPGEADAAALAAALSLASQSLAAAMAGQRPATPPPGAPATSRQDDSASAVSLARGSSAPDLLSIITKDDGAKSSPDATILTGASPAPAPDSNSTSATAIQAAQMSVGSHFGIQHAAANPDATTGDLRAPVGTPAFNDELGGRLTWMAHQGVESGSLQLSPEHLGPLEVRIQVQDGAASVWFGANHADTRAALEQALPHLRQMFASQGLTLSDAGVSREPPRGQAQKPAVAAISSINGVSNEQASLASVSGGRAGLLDTYA